MVFFCFIFLGEDRAFRGDPLPKIVKHESEPDEGLSPPEKKQKTTSALKDLFGDVFITKVEPDKSLFERVDSEINYIELNQILN